MPGNTPSRPPRSEPQLIWKPAPSSVATVMGMVALAATVPDADPLAVTWLTPRLGMRAVRAVAAIASGIVRLPESTPEASAASDPSARSAGGAAGQLSGPCKLTVTVSPGCQPLPWIGTGVLQL